MKVRKVITGSILAAGVGIAGLFGAGAASADVSTNGTDHDAYGYGTANYNANYKDALGTLGSVRSTQTGSEISSVAGTNRIEDTAGVRSTQGDNSLGQMAPISNNGGLNNGVRVGNGR